MRIIYFSRDYTTHDRRFLLKLAESKHEVWYLRLEDDGIPYERQLLPVGIRKVEWTGGKNPVREPEEWLRLIPALDKVIKNIQPNLIHAGPIQSCGFMTAILGFHPFLLMSWGSDILVDAEKDDFWKWMTYYTLQRSDILFCDSQAVRQKVKEFMPYEDERIIQFPWGIDLKKFKPGPDKFNLRKKMGWEESFIIISTRTWEKIYGIDVLLEAFCNAYYVNSKLRLVLLGTGSMSNQIEDIIAKNNLNNIIHRPGQISYSELSNYFQTADLYMSCSQSDGTSISLLEAMASNLPVIVGDIPGNREWIVSHQNGWLVPSGNSSAFAKAIIDAMKSPKKRKQSVLNNRKIVESRANWENNFKFLIEAYNRFEKVHSKQ